MRKNIARKFLIITLCVVATTFIACSFLMKPFSTTANNKTNSINLVPNLIGYDLGTLPNGLKGETYPVFECDVVNQDKVVVGKAESLVYNPNGNLVPVVNGRFSTTEVGTYKIEYFAEYGSLNSSCSIEILVVDSGYTQIKSMVEGESDKTSFSFERYLLPQISFSGGFGFLQTEWRIDYNGNNDCDKVTIDNDKGCYYFVPKYSGVYTWTCKATDIVGKTAVEKGTVIVSDSTTPTMSEPSNSKICHLGETVTFTKAQAKLFDNGSAIYVPVKTYVNEVDVTETMSFKPEVAGEYIVKYEAKNPFDSNADSAVYSYKLTVIDLETKEKNSLYVEQFLQFDGFKSEYRENSILENKVFILNADGSKNNASMNFKNKIDESLLSFEIGFDILETGEHYSNFEQVLVEFCDSINSEEKITVLIKPTLDAKISITVNGIYTTVLDRSMTKYTGDKTYNKLSFSFDNKTKELYESDVVVCNIEKMQNGKEFNGFTSKYAYFSLNMMGINEQSTLKFYNLAGQVINKDTSDKTKPLFIFPDDYSNGFYVDKGQRVTIKKLDVFDFYSTNNRVSLTIQAPDKTKLYSTQNMTEDYVFEVEQDGVYIVSYTIYDQSNNSRMTTAKINVTDRNSPVITPVKISSTAKIGQTIELPKCIATDNLTEECITYVYLIKGNFHKELVYEKYTFTEKGDHHFVYAARDDAGNITTVTYIVNVTP